MRKRAKRDGWSRDLTGAVREAVRAKLAHADGTNESTRAQAARTDSEIVDQASDRGVAVIEIQRADIAMLDQAKRIILTRLIAHLDGRPVDGPFMGEKETPGDLLEKLSRVTQRSIVLGRQAHNLDDVRDVGGSLADLIAAADALPPPRLP